MCFRFVDDPGQFAEGFVFYGFEGFELFGFATETDILDVAGDVDGTGWREGLEGELVGGERDGGVCDGVFGRRKGGSIIRRGGIITIR